MTESLSDNGESAEAAIEAGKLNSQQRKLALFGKIALKIIIGVMGLMIGSVLGFILALTFGIVEFAC